MDFGFSIEAGTVSNFNIKFAPPNAGAYTAAVEMANDSTTTPYIVYLAGTGAKQDQSALSFSPTSPQTYNTTNGLSASGGSGTGAVSYAVASGPGEIVGSTNLHVISGTGMVIATATKAADDMYNSTAATGTVACAKADQTITSPTITDQVVTSVVGLSATASSGLPVSFSVASGPGTISGGATLAFTDTGTVSIAASQAGDTNWSSAPAVTNTFNVLPVPTPAQDGWLAINVTPVGGSWALTVPAGYTNQTFGTGSLAAVSAVTGQYGVSYGALSGYVAPSNQTGFVTAGNTTLFTAVYLQISTNINTPSGVNATEGTYTNKIRVVWNGVDGATGYEIWRSQTNDANAATRIADIPLISLRFTLHAIRTIMTIMPSIRSMPTTTGCGRRRQD